MFDFLRRLFSPSASVSPARQDNFDYESLELPFQTQIVHGSQALEMRDHGDSAESKSVVMGTGEEVSLIVDLLSEFDGSTRKILDDAERFNIDQWISNRLQGEDCSRPNDGEWPGHKVPPIEMGLHLELISGRPKEKVIVGTIPVSNSWEIPAVLRYGDWNDCPSPHIHVALHKRWNRDYGSEIIGISGDVIQCSVTRRPSTEDEAMQLAMEQFVYCTDNVFQGYLTLRPYAAALMNSDYWYFWWD